MTKREMAGHMMLHRVKGEITCMMEWSSSGNLGIFLYVSHLNILSNECNEVMRKYSFES